MEQGGALASEAPRAADGPARLGALSDESRPHMTSVDVAARLDQLAADVARLKPISSRNPHAFYEDRSELASRVRAIATQLRAPAAAAAAPQAPAPIGAQSVRHETRHIAGRTVLVLTRSQR